MSKKGIKEGDYVQVFDVKGNLIVKGFVLSTAVATGDTWTIQPHGKDEWDNPYKEEAIVEIQTFGYMELITQPNKEG